MARGCGLGDTSLIERRVWVRDGTRAVSGDVRAVSVSGGTRGTIVSGGKQRLKARNRFPASLVQRPSPSVLEVLLPLFQDLSREADEHVPLRRQNVCHLGVPEVIAIQLQLNLPQPWARGGLQSRELPLGVEGLQSPWEVECRVQRKRQRAEGGGRWASERGGGGGGSDMTAGGRAPLWTVPDDAKF